MQRCDTYTSSPRRRLKPVVRTYPNTAIIVVSPSRYAAVSLSNMYVDATPAQGEWLTYLASITLIEKIASSPPDGAVVGSGDNGDNGTVVVGVNTMISILILVKLLPNVLFMPLGGVLADKYDRRTNQIVLDVASSLVVLIYLAAVQFQSIPILYLATFCQESLSGLYLPSNSAIIPLLTSSEVELEKATTLSAVTWSLVAALGSSLGGVLVATIGLRGCFAIDSVTYLVSAALLTYGVQGTFVVVAATDEEAKRGRSAKTPTVTEVDTVGGGRRESDDSTRQPQLRKPRLSSSFQIKSATHAVTGLKDTGVESGIDAEVDHTHTVLPPSQLDMFVQGLHFAFVVEPTVGAYALLKGSAALTYGATDILNVAFSVIGSEDDPRQTSFKLGLLFACVGIGCIIGSTLCDRYASLSRPQEIVPLTLSGLLLMSVACLFMGLFPEHFACICLSGIVRSIGSSLLWICSTLLLQKYSPAAILGRVESIDLSAGLFGEAVSALGAGLVMDDFGVSPEVLSLILAAVAFGSFVFWNVMLLLVLKPPTTVDNDASRFRNNHG